MKKNLPQFLLSIFVLLSFPAISAKSQCIADAGIDKTMCAGWSDSATVQLGGSPATGGTGPYTYTWEAVYNSPISNNTYTASYFLNDTTSANPVLVNSPGHGDNLYFYLTVTDANNMVCKDTVNIRFSRFMSSLGMLPYSILYGDSVYLSGTNIFGGIPPYTYLWYPNHGLVDSTSLSFWAKPNTTTFYSVIVTDSVGCKGVDGNYHQVTVGFANIHEQNASKAEIYPNPTNDILYIRMEKFEGGNLRLDVLDVTGKLCLSKNISSTETALDAKQLKAGLYNYRIVGSSGASSGKFVVK